MMWVQISIGVVRRKANKGHEEGNVATHWNPVKDVSMNQERDQNV